MPQSRRTPAPHRADLRRRRLRATALLVLAVLAGVGVALLARGGGGGPGGGPRARLLLPGSGAGNGVDPLRYDGDRRGAYEAGAAAGLAHVLYAKSPGGALASAGRTARWRPLIEKTAKTTGVDADTLEAIVFLESAGRADARASSDLDGAAGLTQILAQTATGLLGLKVDVKASERLTRGIARGRRVPARERARRRVDERFDPAKALAATARYLKFAHSKLHRDDLAIASYHMGVGNLQQALSLYGADDIPFAQLFFDSSPLQHAGAYAKLAALGDDSSTYLWRIRAAQQIMRAYRADPAALQAQATLQTGRNSAELVLHPPGSTPAYADPAALKLAVAAGTLTKLDPRRLRRYGVGIDRSAGELAPRLGQSRRLYRALRPEALAVLLYLGAGTRAITGAGTLAVTSAARDARYQRLLTARNIEATRSGYSLHTTGYTFDISRRYDSHAQALAFQFLLDRLTALNVIAWVREPTAIHITVGAAAHPLLGLLRAGAAPPPPPPPR